MGSKTFFLVSSLDRMDPMDHSDLSNRMLDICIQTKTHVDLQIHAGQKQSIQVTVTTIILCISPDKRTSQATSLQLLCT